MDHQPSEEPKSDPLIGLGMVLGQNQTFGLLAGRCSAAQAETIRRLRVEKIYKRVTEDWKEFCATYLHMSGTQADRIIRLWEEFGAGYFELAQLTRLSPETYRAIEPAVADGVLHLNGEEIELTIENSRRVAAAVTEMRRSLPAKSSPTDRVERLEQLCATLIEEFRAIPDDSTEAFARYRMALTNLYSALKNIRQQLNC
jgi:hypothetical protein